MGCWLLGASLEGELYARMAGGYWQLLAVTAAGAAVSRTHLTTVIKHKDLPMLERRHGSGINVQIWICVWLYTR